MSQPPITKININIRAQQTQVSGPIQCFTCKKFGHKADRCYSNDPQKKSNEVEVLKSNLVSGLKKLTSQLESVKVDPPKKNFPAASPTVSNHLNKGNTVKPQNPHHKQHTNAKPGPSQLGTNINLTINNKPGGKLNTKNRVNKETKPATNSKPAPKSTNLRGKKNQHALFLVD